MFIVLCVFSFIAIVGVVALLAKNNLAIVLLNSIFSICLGVLYVVFNSPDVALTEVAINVFLSSAILFTTLKITNDKSNSNKNIILRKVGGGDFIKKLLIFIVFGLVFYFIAFTLLNILQSIDVNITQKLNDKSSLWYNYINLSIPLTGVKNVVTSTLASFRGLDTMFETFVIFLTSICVYFIFYNNNKDSAL